MDSHAARGGLPNKIPAHLLRQLSTLAHDHDSLKQLFGDKGDKGVKPRSSKSKAPYTFRLASTKEEISVRRYCNSHKLLFPHCQSKSWDASGILVAFIESLGKAVILGRPPGIGHYKLRIWRGVEGFDESEAGLVIKATSEDAFLRLQASIKSSIEEDITGLFDSAPVSESAILHDQSTISNSSTIPESTYASTGSTSYTRGPLTPEPTPQHAITSKQDPGVDPEATDLTPDDIAVCFINHNHMVTRERPSDHCNTVDKLFAQAACAGIIKTDDGAATLTAGVSDRDLPLMRGDEDDFRNLVLAVADEVKKRIDRRIEVYVRAL